MSLKFAHIEVMCLFIAAKISDRGDELLTHDLIEVLELCMQNHFDLFKSTVNCCSQL